MTGKTFANYRIEEKLGEGGMGVVYKATDMNLDRFVAIKLLSSELSRDSNFIERFRAEAKAQAHLNHTNIASLYSFFNAEGQDCIVMEYVEGETLAQMLGRRGLIPWQEAIPLFRQALLGIGFAHRAGIVHRDIKPGNIMVNSHGMVKVMDFGIAKPIGGTQLTRTGVGPGTIGYRSPEQILNRAVDIRSDIYSLGVTLYQLLTAHLPFEADSAFEVESGHVHTPPPPPTRHYPYIPRGIEQCVLKAVEKDPDARFQTVEEFGSALEHPEGIEEWLASRKVRQMGNAPGTHPAATAAPGAPVRPSSTGSAPIPALHSPSWSKKRLLIGGGAVLVLALGISGYEMFKPKPTSTIASDGSAGGGTRLVASDAPPPVPSPFPTGTRGSNSAATSTGDAVLNLPASEPTPQATPADSSLEAMQNARRALRNNRFFRPPKDCAFYWAKQAEQNGNSEGSQLEEEIFESAAKRVNSLTNANKFPAASALVAQMRESYPGKPELKELSASVLDQEVKYEVEQPPPPLPTPPPPAASPYSPPAASSYSPSAASPYQQPSQSPYRPPVPPQPLRSVPLSPPPPGSQRQQPSYVASFGLQHRHTFGAKFENRSCFGTLTVSSTEIRYDCLTTQDLRCDHVRFNAKNIKELKTTRHGSGLHIATWDTGNWDFSGVPQQVQGAFEAINQFKDR